MTTYSISLEKRRVLMQMIENLYEAEQTDYEKLAEQFGLPRTFLRDVVGRYASSVEVSPARADEVYYCLSVFTRFGRSDSRR